MTAPSGPDTVDLDDVAGWLDVWHYAAGEIGKLKAQQDEARERIEAALGQAREGKVRGRVAVRRTMVETTRLDIKAVREKYPDVAAACSKTTVSPRFTVLDEAA